MRNVLYLDGTPMTWDEYVAELWDCIGVLGGEVEVEPDDADIPLVRFRFFDAVVYGDGPDDWRQVDYIAEIPLINWHDDTEVFESVEMFVRAQMMADGRAR